ncbi:hypothetical protein [Streptomyces sp. NPDC059979]|uniref:hypothetical protein n=1 Tax=Streptomyces sp. NPDC059979 TaxID=3347021 RepID=UPI0036925C99
MEGEALRCIVTGRDIALRAVAKEVDSDEPVRTVMTAPAVTVDVADGIHVPGRRAAVIETLGAGELVGCSWLFKPYTWRLGAEAMTPVRAYEFDALRVRALMEADCGFGSALGHWVGQVLAHRLQAARIRLLDLYAPYGSGRYV